MKEKDKLGIWDSAKTALGEFTDEALLGGAGEYAYKHLNPNKKMNIDKLREQNPVLANIAEYGGMATGFINPFAKFGNILKGLKLAKGTIKGAKTLNKLGKAASYLL